MEKRRIISERTLLVLVTAVTVILIVGSAILQRIVFKADEATATAFIDQSVTAKPNETFELPIKSEISNIVAVAGAQFSLTFDNDLVEFVGISDVPGWETIKVVKTEQSIKWAVLPGTDAGLSVRQNAVTTFGTLRFKALKEGVAEFNLDPITTIIGVVSSDNPQVVTNVLASTQNAQIAISNTTPAKNGQDPNLLVENITENFPETTFSSQRLISQKPLVSASSAIIFVKVQYPSRISIRFGQSDLLTNTAQFATVADEAAIKLSGLEPGAKYQYQVIALAPDATSQITSQIKSFTLPLLSTEKAVERVVFEVFPTKAEQTTTAYAVFYDKEGNVISGLAPTVSLNSNETKLGKIGESLGIHQVSIDSTNQSRKLIRADLIFDGKEIASKTILFDPENVQENIRPTVDFPVLAFDQKTTYTLLGLLIALFILGIGFFRLARAK